MGMEDVHVSFAQIESKVENKATHRERGKVGNRFRNHVPNELTDSYINLVNENQHLYTW
jgi:hypothetical protein